MIPHLQPRIWEPKEGYDAVADWYEGSHWYKFWNRNEVPYFERVAENLHDSTKFDGLDLGSGTGRYSVLLAKYCRKVTAIDISPGMIRAARKRHNIGYRLGDVRYGIPSGDWSLVTLARVLSHVHQPNDVLKSILRSSSCKDVAIFISDIHPSHRYLATSFDRRGEKVFIETLKHKPESIIAGTDLQWFYKEFHFSDLMWQPEGTRFTSVDRLSINPIFFCLWGVRGEKWENNITRSALSIGLQNQVG